jgi:topoisomerase IA-like protein
MSLRKKFKQWFGFPTPVLDADAFLEEIDKEEKVMPAKKKPAVKKPAVKKAPVKKTTAKKTTKKK